MNRDDIIRMAREAGKGTIWWPVYRNTIERFAALVAAAEREACAEIAEEWNDMDFPRRSIAELIRARGEK